MKSDQISGVFWFLACSSVFEQYRVAFIERNSFIRLSLVDDFPFPFCLLPFFTRSGGVATYMFFSKGCKEQHVYCGG